MSDMIMSHRPPLLDVGTLELIRKGEISVATKNIAKFHAKGVEFEGGAKEDFDAVVLATGFKVRRYFRVH